MKTNGIEYVEAIKGIDGRLYATVDEASIGAILSLYYNHVALKRREENKDYYIFAFEKFLKANWTEIKRYMKDYG